MQESESESPQTGRRTLPLAVAAIGVVFGDIGTSPLYALRECFSPIRGVAQSEANVLGVVSLIVWAISLVVCFKYLLVVLRADNRGEGGILALVSLAGKGLPAGKRAGLLASLGILGAALLFSDGMITPSISVLSAMEGLDLVSPAFREWVVPLSLLVLIVLFMMQSRGTARVGGLFAPVLILWFVVIGILGALSIIRIPGILRAFDPRWAIAFIGEEGLRSVGVLGSVFLALTGAEVLYADLGHFGRRPIAAAWFRLVYPALILNYLGQGALLLDPAGRPDHLFYGLVPAFATLPMVILATAATIIASQAVISGAYSIARQAVQLGFLPRIQVRHTSESKIGQVYVPLVNWLLMIGTIGLVVSFRESTKLAGAYGIAVSIDMLITSCVMLYLGKKHLHFPLWAILPLGSLFVVIDSGFLISNLTKLPAGGWIVVVLAICIVFLMKTWADGRALFREKMSAFRIEPDVFAQSIALNPPFRIPGSAVFLTGDPNGVPKSLLHNLKHNRILHETTLILSVLTAEIPVVPHAEKAQWHHLAAGIWKATASFGFSETPDIPALLKALDIPDISTKIDSLTYFVGRETIVMRRGRSRTKAGEAGRMSIFRRKVFSLMFANSLNATQFFRLPPNSVVEIGGQTEL